MHVVLGIARGAHHADVPGSAGLGSFVCFRDGAARARALAVRTLAHHRGRCRVSIVSRLDRHGREIGADVIADHAQSAFHARAGRVLVERYRTSHVHEFGMTRLVVERHFDEPVSREIPSWNAALIHVRALLPVPVDHAEEVRARGLRGQYHG